jgi:hypothetical protein
MKKEKSFKSCYVIAPFSKDTYDLIDLLKRHGIQTNGILSFSDSDISLSNTIEEGIRKVDFVCAFIPPKASPTIFYEVGIARGAKKPIFMIIEEKSLPDMYLHDMVYVRASIKDQNAIEFALDQFLAKYRQISKRIPLNKEVRSEKLEIKPFQDSLELISKENNPFEIESFVADLFKYLKDVTIVERQELDKGIDMALWVDNLEPYFGNPILVEVKSRVRSKSLLMKAEDQLRNYLEKTNASLGLLIYLGNDIKKMKNQKIRQPLVIWLELHELVSMLSKNSLAEIIMAKRNEMIHPVYEE